MLITSSPSPDSPSLPAVPDVHVVADEVLVVVDDAHSVIVRSALRPTELVSA
jgi:hypothetical protein